MTGVVLGSLSWGPPCANAHEAENRRAIKKIEAFIANLPAWRSIRCILLSPRKRVFPDRSLVAQRVHRIQSRGFHRWINTKEQTYAHRSRYRGDDRPKRNG